MAILVKKISIQKKVKLNEILGEYNLLENFKITSTAYRTRIKDRIKIKSDWSAYENKEADTTQEGLESEIKFFGTIKACLLFHTLQKVGQTQEAQILEDQTCLTGLITLQKNLISWLWFF